MKISWIPGERPGDMLVTQVYGIVFDQHGRILVQNDNGRYNLPGGKPEGTETPEETLRRECLEESNVVAEDIRYLGYCRVEDEADPRSPYAQMRYIARLGAVGRNFPDPSTHRAYGRELLPPDEAIRNLGWGPHGAQQIRAAVEVALLSFGIKRKTAEREVISDKGASSS